MPVPGSPHIDTEQDHAFRTRVVDDRQDVMGRVETVDQAWVWADPRVLLRRAVPNDFDAALNQMIVVLGRHHPLRRPGCDLDSCKIGRVGLAAIDAART